MTFSTDSPQSCGIVELDEKGVVQGFHEKVSSPPGNLANAAVFLFGPEAADTIARLDSKVDLDISRDLIPQLIGRLNTWHNDTYHRDIGSPEALRAAALEFPPIYSQFKVKA